MKVQVLRTHGLVGKVTVNWRSLAVKALHGHDYDGSTGKLTFKHNQVVKTRILSLSNKIVFYNLRQKYN